MCRYIRCNYASAHMDSTKGTRKNAAFCNSCRILHPCTFEIIIDDIYNVTKCIFSAVRKWNNITYRHGAEQQ